MSRQTKRRTCLTCGIPFYDVDISECRGEQRGESSWCNGDHNCYICRLRSSLVGMVACREGGSRDDFFGPDEAIRAWFDSLPEDHPIRVQIEEDVAHLSENLAKGGMI